MVYKIFLAASSFLITSGLVIVRRAEKDDRPPSHTTRSQSPSPIRGVSLPISQSSTSTMHKSPQLPRRSVQDHYSLRAPVPPAASIPELVPPQQSHSATITVDLSTRVIGHGNHIRLPAAPDTSALANILASATKLGSDVTIKTGASIYGSKNIIAWETPTIAEGSSAHSKKRKNEARDEKTNYKRRG